MLTNGTINIMSGVKVLPTIRNMEIGDSISFPAERYSTVRTAMSNLSFMLDRKYVSRRDLENRLVVVERTR